MQVLAPSANRSDKLPAHAKPSAKPALPQFLLRKFTMQVLLTPPN